MILWTQKITPQEAAYRVKNSGGKSGQIKVGIYCRVSTHDQMCDRQRADLLEFASRCNYNVVEIFTEVGSGAKNDRLERREVIQLARARSIDAVLVTEISRWGRSTADLILTLEELATYGVSLIAQNGFQFDLSTPHGRLIAQILASMAEFERELIRERVRSGLANARSRGKVFGRPKGGKTKRNCTKIRELNQAGQSLRSIGKQVGLSKTAVANCLNRDVDRIEVA
jgi:putative DNA-invertase from lambdoid prophage Rac